jgi:hypothetical protein
MWQAYGESSEGNPSSVSRNFTGFIGISSPSGFFQTGKKRTTDYSHMLQRGVSF